MIYFLAALALALVHFLASRLHPMEQKPRSRWLSLAGGASVAYVFLLLFPELERRQEEIRRFFGGESRLIEYPIYLLVLVGLVSFYGLERLATHSRQGRGADGDQRQTSRGVFWVHVGSFALYNLVVGYLLLHRHDTSVSSTFLFTIALALHFFVNDYALEEHHGEMYERMGRWLLAGTVLLGWLIGTVARLPTIVVGILLALLVGAFVVNTLKEELPAEEQSNFWALLAGVTGYTLLLLAF